MSLRIYNEISKHCQEKNWTIRDYLYILMLLFKNRFHKVNIMGFMQKISESRAAFIGAFTAAAFAAGTAATTLGASPANAQDNNQIATRTTSNLPGKHVTLRVGPGLDQNAKDMVTLAARDLERNGCTAEITTERGFPGHVTVDIEGFRPSKFNSKEIASAGFVAKERCLTI